MSEAHAEVMRRYGMDIADDLESSGLLRADTMVEASSLDNPKATHWRLRVWSPKGRTAYYGVPDGLRNELKTGLRNCGEAFYVTDKVGLAKRYATMATNYGLNAQITAMVMSEATE